MIRITLAHEGIRVQRRADLFPEETENITMIAARNDFAAAALFVQADEELLLNVGRAEAFTPQSTRKTLRFELDAPFAGELRLVDALPGDDNLPVGEVVLNAPTLEAPARRTQELFLTLDIPADAKPGSYTGCVKVWQHEGFRPETLLETLPFAVEVHSFVLPRQRALHLDLWQHWSVLALHAEVPLWSEAHFASIDRVMQTMQELGTSSLTLMASEAPWSGQKLYERDFGEIANLFEYSTVGITKTAKDWQYDYSVMDRLVEMADAHGIAREIEIFGLINIWQSPAWGYGQPSDYPDGVRLRYLDEATGGYAYMTDGQDVRAYMRALEAHFAEKGWLDRIRLAADEPGDLEAFRRSINALDEAMPRCKKKAALNHVEFVEEYADRIADYVPSIGVMSKKYDALKRIRPMIAGRLCWYLCCGPDHPNTFLKSPLIESRLMGIITGFLGYDGFLRWAYCCWPRHPRQSASMDYPFWSAGDFGFVYPNGNGDIIKSLRWFSLKRGMDDETLIRTAREKGVELEPIFAKIFSEQDPRIWEFELPEPRFYSLNPADYDAFRRALLTALD